MKRKSEVEFAVLMILPIIIFTSLGFYGTFLSSRTDARHLLIVNTWNDFPKENATDVDAMPAQALQAYLALKSRGYLEDEICLMLYHSNDEFIDVDGNDSNDLEEALIDVENDAVNKENLEIALEGIGSISEQYDEVVIYVVSHGHKIGENSSTFSFENGDLVVPEEFGKWLSNINCKHMVVLLDFCFSGNFAKSLEKPGRLVICSAENGKESWYYWNWARLLNETDKAIFGDSGSTFFHPFWRRMGEGATLEEAFEYGKEESFRWGYIDNRSKNTTQIQNPQMYIRERNLLESFVFFYPGGPLGLLIATVVLVLVEVAIITAAVASIRSSARILNK